MLVAREQLSAMVERILARQGVPRPHARIQADLFIGADMRGTASHGLLRLRRVVERLKLGLAAAGETGKQEWTARSFLSVDGRRGLGPVVALVHADTGSGDAAASQAQARWMAGPLDTLLAPGGLVLSDQNMSDGPEAPQGWRAERLPAGVPAGRYFAYRKPVKA